MKIVYGYYTVYSKIGQVFQLDIEIKMPNYFPLSFLPVCLSVANCNLVHFPLALLLLIFQLSLPIFLFDSFIYFFSSLLETSLYGEQLKISLPTVMFSVT